MTYFAKFPLYLTRKTGNINVIMTDLFRRMGVGGRFNDVSVVLLPYLVKDGETPPMVANAFYGNPFYHWVVLHVNEIVNVNTEWPIPNNSVSSLVDEKISQGIYTGRNDVHHWVDATNGYTVDYSITNPNLYSVSNYEYEEQLNDKKRNIRILDPKFLAQVVREFETKIGA
jgi:hypothetical protein